MRIIKILSYVLTCAALFVAGYGAGLCVKVFMARGVPVVNGGGELMLLLVIPACVYAGYRLGVWHMKMKLQGRRADEAAEHTDH